MGFESFLSKMAEFSGCVTVIGDAMIDEYYSVFIDRISPEFPIPIMLSENCLVDHSLPGGAANVCYQFSGINKNINLCTFVDSYSDIIFKKNNIITDNSIVIDPYCIPVKKRFYHKETPFCRWDVESKNYGMDIKQLKNLRNELFANCSELLSKSDVIIFSDYDKGIFNNELGSISPLLNKSALKVVDPKLNDLDKWIGCDVFKPNASEAFKLSGGIKDIKEQCKYFYDRLSCSSVVITRAGDTVSVYDKDGYWEYKNPKEKTDVCSVIGAGDCFISILSVALVSGISIRDAAALSFEAGKIYVQKKHNSPVYLHDLWKNKLIDYRLLKNRNFSLVFTNGCFDVLHKGHLSTLEFAKTQGEKLVVAVNSDESVKRLKGEGRPVNSLQDRMMMLSSLSCVDFVVSFDDNTPLKLIEEIRPDTLVKGGDYNIKNIVGNEIVKKVVAAPFLKGCSTTEIINKINNI